MAPLEDMLVFVGVTTNPFWDSIQAGWSANPNKNPVQVKKKKKKVEKVKVPGGQKNVFFSHFFPKLSGMY